MREVVMILPRDGGAVLKLDCSHQIWAAGFDTHGPRGQWPCLGGCYQPQLAMGRDC
jgi:hypothetical protein